MSKMSSHFCDLGGRRFASKPNPLCQSYFRRDLPSFRNVRCFKSARYRPEGLFGARSRLGDRIRGASCHRNEAGRPGTLIRKYPRASIASFKLEAIHSGSVNSGCSLSHVASKCLLPKGTSRHGENLRARPLSFVLRPRRRMILIAFVKLSPIVRLSLSVFASRIIG
jgi:hypothetical protein